MLQIQYCFELNGRVVEQILDHLLLQDVDGRQDVLRHHQREEDPAAPAVAPGIRKPPLRDAVRHKGPARGPSQIRLPTLEELSLTPAEQEEAEDQDEDEEAQTVEWERGAIADDLKNALDTPDDLDLHEDYKEGAPMTKKQLRTSRTKMSRILRKLKRAWFPAWSYAGKAGSLLSRHITPPKGCKTPDARHLSLDYPDLLELLQERELLLVHQGAGAPHGFLQAALTEVAEIQESLGSQEAEEDR
mmetsp:Transcript_62393/g.129546  ORF Transcript_62393/g.129546 Transcript_62393/m.129546 type:complete len:245 (+) Transcript_62393:566-1300(+)